MMEASSDRQKEDAPRPPERPSSPHPAAVSFRLRSRALGFEEVVALRAVTCALKATTCTAGFHSPGPGDCRASPAMAAGWLLVRLAGTVSSRRPRTLSSPFPSLTASLRIFPSFLLCLLNHSFSPPPFIFCPIFLLSSGDAPLPPPSPSSFPAQPGSCSRCT